MQPCQLILILMGSLRFCINKERGYESTLNKLEAK